MSGISSDDGSLCLRRPGLASRAIHRRGDLSTPTRESRVTSPAKQPRPRYEHVYLHVPFCGRRCSYCDFAIAVRREVPVRAFIDAIMAEVVTRQLEPDRQLRTLYLGGGTPSKLGGAGVAELLDRLLPQLVGADLSTYPQSVEITVEANPEDVNEEAAEAWVRAGVNRVSLGVQSFDPGVLGWMHRGHGPEAAGAAVQLLRSSGLTNISLDLIFALPSDQRRDWSRDLALALALEPTHLSLYGLTVEPHTPLGRWRDRGAVDEAPEERYEAEFLEAHRTLAGAGFEHYEVSNFGRPGLHSRHNSAYWTGAAYLGLGPSAHGFAARVRRWNISAFAAWEAAVLGGSDPIEGSETIGPTEATAEEVYLGLRTAGGLHVLESEQKVVTSWINQGWGSLEDGRLVLTPEGWLRLDALAASLTSLRSHS
jgi:oxygen-independent coproporphyrinogen III oxidase